MKTVTAGQKSATDGGEVGICPPQHRHNFYSKSGRALATQLLYGYMFTNVLYKLVYVIFTPIKQCMYVRKDSLDIYVLQYIMKVKFKSELELVCL